MGNNVKKVNVKYAEIFLYTFLNVSFCEQSKILQQPLTEGTAYG